MYYHTNVDLIQTCKLRIYSMICFTSVEVEFAGHVAISKKFLGRVPSFKTFLDAVSSDVWQ